MSQHDHMWALLGEVHPHVAQEQPEERQKFGERVKRRETCQVCSLARNATFHGNLCSECEYNMRVVGQRVYRGYDGQREWPSPEIAWLQMQHQNCQDCGKPDHVYIYIFPNYVQLWPFTSSEYQVIPCMLYVFCHRNHLLFHSHGHFTV